MSMPLSELSAVKLALMARKVREQSAQVLQADPVAIIGMACRAPGGADTPKRLWELLRDGRDTIREVPADRWDADAWFDADPSAIAKSSTREGGFIDRIDGFDAAYFNILPREAERMDPQQRLLLEVTVEAIDDAGIAQERLRGTRSGVFIASYHNDYSGLQYRDVEAIDARTLTGTLHSVLTNRLSYFLDLKGPSISIDTACSSSLVAIHLACQSLRLGESDMALAGGVSLMISPELMISMSKVGFMAPDGRCKTFDALADGFGRGEGCGVVVLKRLSDAIADNDRVLAVIRGSAVNSDGHSTVLAAPNGLAQQAMIREALANGQLAPERIGYVEAHGTGTALGDPIEVEALAATVGRHSAGAGPCYVGSAKANLGHLEAAAGVMGLIKSVLVLRNEAVPPQVHFSRINPHIDLDGTRLAIPTSLVPWPRGRQPRCAAVSSFGVGGTNAHVIIEESPATDAADQTDDLADMNAATAGEADLVLPLSAHGPDALRALANTWIPFLRETPATAADLCYTATQRRSHYDCRLAVVGNSKAALCDRLAEYLRDEPSPGTAIGQLSAAAPTRVAFVFSGQGPQWYAMGRELLAQEPVFRAVLTECDALLRPLAGWSLLEQLAAPEEHSRIGHTEIAQPALFAIQAGIAALLQSWGLAPDGVVGHSVGEIAALHVAGVLSLPEALDVVCRRGRIMQAATGLGRMASVNLGEDEAAALLRDYDGRISLGAINGPRSVVISGESGAIEAALAGLSARGIGHRMLPVQYAFHSAQMTPFQQRLAEELAGLRTAIPSMPIYSTVTGCLATRERFDGAYFGRNVRDPVRLAGAIEAMAKDGYSAFVEIGPHPVLAASISECLDAGPHSALVIGTLRRGRAERESLLQACAKLYAVGRSPEWDAVQSSDARLASLPAYPWQRKRYWIRTRPEGSTGVATAQAVGHPLLGRRIPAAGMQAQLFGGDSQDAHAWLADHRIFGRLLMPAAGVLEIFHAAAREAIESGSPRLTEFTMLRPMFLAEREAPPSIWQSVVRTDDPQRIQLELYEALPALDDGPSGWRLVATACATADESADAGVVGAAAASPAAVVAVIDPAGEPVVSDSLVSRFTELGVAFGPHFQCLSDVRRRDGVAEGWIELPEDLRADADRYGVHPVMLDAALQLCSVAAAAGPGGELPAGVVLPLGADRFRILRPVPRRVRGRARLQEVGDSGSFAAEVTLVSEHGELVAVIEGMRFAPAQPGAFAAASARDDALYRIGWDSANALPMPAAASAAGPWLVFTDRQGAGAALARQLEAAGGRVCLVAAGDRFEQTAADRWVVDPADPAHFSRVLATEQAVAGNRLRGVVHLWNLDIATLETGSASRLAQEDLLGTGSVLHLVQALAGAGFEETGPLWLVGRGAQVVTAEEPAHLLRPRAAGIWGLGNVVAAEHPELNVHLVDLDPVAPADDVAGLVAELLARQDTGRAVSIRGTGRWMPKLERYRPRGAPRDPEVQDGQPLQLRLVRPGTLDGTELQRCQRPSLGRDEVRLRVLASGLNFRDVLLTLGMYPGGDVPLGAECAGIVSEVGADVREFAIGETVFGLAPGALGTEVVAPAAFLAAVPPGLGAESAAAIPVAFLTAYYGLHRLANLRAGERILIHAAAGGVGLAAVQLARRCGAEIFATAGSDEKRSLLRSMGVAHVLDSRSLSFADDIRRATAGEGVHVVLNSLAGDFIRASLDVLASGGCFLELGKRDIMTREGVAQARPGVRYYAYDLGGEALADRGLVRPMLDAILAALKDGSLSPLPVTVYGLRQAQDAFRYMAQARHVGKIVLRPEGAGQARAGRRELASPHATYWITGGLGGLGIATAAWLVDAGARNLVLTDRSGPGPAAIEAVRNLEARGARIRVLQADASDRARMKSILEEINASEAPLRGVIHAAGMVDDAILMRQTWERCRGVLAGKADGAWLLHELTRDAALDFFVLYSAAGVLLGASGQGAYAAANAELDALAHARHRLGLPALSVAWGPWAGVGMAADLAARGSDAWLALGLGRIEPSEGLAHLERLLRDDATYAAVMPIHWPTFLAATSRGIDHGFFRAMRSAPRAAGASPAVAPGVSVLARLRDLPGGQQRPALVDYLRERALNVLGLQSTTPVDPRMALKDTGLDSLMAVELRNALTRSLARPLPATLLFDYPTLDALADYLARVLDIASDARAASGADAASLRTPTGDGAEAADDLTALSDDEAEALLLEELNGATAGKSHD